MTQQLEKQQKLELRAIKLVFDYYRYFLNCDEAVQFGGVNGGSYWSWQAPGQYTYINLPPIVWLRKYKTPAKRKEVDKMHQLLTLSPDLEVVDKSDNHSYRLEVTWVNPELPSIKNNSLGFERNVETNTK